jgi:hypothetical protein
VAQARDRAGLIRAAALLALAAVIGCGPDPFAARHPEVAAIGGQKLGDANPFVLAWQGRVRFFHCRWPDGAAVPVALPTDLSDVERRALDTALAAWEEAGLGIRFERVDAAPTGIDVRLVGGTVDTAAGQDTANTVVDCAIAPLAEQTGDAIAGATLASARITIARITDQDMQGHQRPLTAAELTGAALHELGHALGFQGHARHGDTIMVRETEKIMHTGKRLLAGGAFGDASLRALYRLSSGAVVGGGAVAPCHTDLVDRMAELAVANHLDGPFVRVGETAGRIFWRDAKHLEYGLLVARIREARRDPARLVILPERRVRASLAPALDRACKAP